MEARDESEDASEGNADPASNAAAIEGELLTFNFPEPRQYEEPLCICLGDPRVLVSAIYEVAAALRVSDEAAFADTLYALASRITERYGKLAWDAPIPEQHLRAAMVQALALVPVEKLRKLHGPHNVGLVAVGEAGEA